MLTGTSSVPRVIEESICRSAEDDKFTNVGDYKIHSTALMPNIQFEQAKDEPFVIDSSIFINDSETQLQFNPTNICQNYILCKYIGKQNLEFYGPPTKMGREFVLICRQGNPGYEHRVFGTEEAIRGYNPTASENIEYPKKKQYGTV